MHFFFCLKSVKPKYPYSKDFHKPIEPKPKIFENLQNRFTQSLTRIILNPIHHQCLLVLERAHFLLNSSFIKLHNFELEYIASSSFFHFLSLNSSLKTNFTRLGPNMSSILSFIEFEIAVFEFRVARTSCDTIQCFKPRVLFGLALQNTSARSSYSRL